MQYKIPQNVQIEDKIAGPLDLKQLRTFWFWWSHIYFIRFSKNYFIEIWLPAIIYPQPSLCFQFCKHQYRTFYRWIFLVVEYFKNLVNAASTWAQTSTRPPCLPKDKKRRKKKKKNEKIKNKLQKSATTNSKNRRNQASS